MVPKPHGIQELCVDYRKVNAITKSDSYPVPRLEGYFEKVFEPNREELVYVLLFNVLVFCQVKKEVGDVSILINNAGIVTGKKFMESPDALLEKTMEVNSLAHFWTYKAFLPAMIASNHGHLVSIASTAGLFPVNGLADYCASKFAAVGFAESVALELLVSGKNGVRTTIVCPYFINTGMFDGCKTKWPHLLPILDVNYAAKKITDAILRDQVLLVMPRSLYFMFAIKNLLPVKLGILLGHYFGVFNVMDHFKVSHSYLLFIHLDAFIHEGSV
ncbi:epidermal retinol dehydrogenase 2 [Chiloscyllium plagiosum]|uniref:epidermal retinol dehydrogenase 2 n=1 Tax=Chiloscyllium plagiosum TaxID=36176 RepID=UPI001CB7DA6E|nr:epidermal retinol dehydrogenase 2 [Chiloscyllium plagiosum]